MPTLAEIDEAITNAWHTYVQARLEGSEDIARVAMKAVDRRLDERLALMAPVAA